jgi:hypothetical protein
MLSTNCGQPVDNIFYFAENYCNYRVFNVYFVDKFFTDIIQILDYKTEYEVS